VHTLVWLALLLLAGLAGCSSPEAESPPADVSQWDTSFPAWTPGWTLAYAAPGDAAEPDGYWVAYTFRGDETVRHVSRGNETANWTARRMDVTERPFDSGQLAAQTIWYDVETAGMVRMKGGGLDITSECPLQDMRVDTVREWSCWASSWYATIRQERVESGEVVLAGQHLTEHHFSYRTVVNNAVDEKTFAYSPELGFLTRFTGYGDSSGEHVLQSVGACRGPDGMLMPDPSPCSPWPDREP
jgi:hypothetical protein